MKIRSKRQFFELWEAGVLGNRTQLWRDPWEAFCWAEEHDAEIGFREIRKYGSSGAGAWTKVPWTDVLGTAAQWRAAGRDFIMDDGCPDDCRTLQGEVCRTYRGLEGYLDTVAQLPMRPALAAGHMRHCSGATVLALLGKFMDPSSQDDLWALLDLYEDHVVEFSCFGKDVGVFPNRNCLFWEVRGY